LPQVEIPIAFGNAKQDRTFRCIGPEDLVEDGLEEQNAEGIERANHGQQQHAGQPLQCVWQPEAQKAEEVLHAGLTAVRARESIPGL